MTGVYILGESSGGAEGLHTLGERLRFDLTRDRVERGGRWWCHLTSSTLATPVLAASLSLRGWIFVRKEARGVGVRHLTCSAPPTPVRCLLYVVVRGGYVFGEQTLASEWISSRYPHDLVAAKIAFTEMFVMFVQVRRRRACGRTNPEKRIAPLL